MTGCGAVGVPGPVLAVGPQAGTAAGQQSHLHGGHAAPAVHAGQPHPQAPVPVAAPPSAGGLIRTH